MNSFSNTRQKKKKSWQLLKIRRKFRFFLKWTRRVQRWMSWQSNTQPRCRTLAQFKWDFYHVMTQWICAPPLQLWDKPALLSMAPLHEGGDNRSRPVQKLSRKKKKKIGEQWLRDLIKSSLVDSDAWWRAHYEAWSFSNDTTVSRTCRERKKKRKKEKTWLGWQALSDTANLLITWKLEGAHAKKEINLAGVHLAQIAKLWICFQIMSLPACQLTCHFL